MKIANGVCNLPPQNWRDIERKLVTAFRWMGVPLRDSYGVPFVIDRYYDYDSGELLRLHYVLNIQELAQLLCSRDVCDPVSKLPLVHARIYLFPVLAPMASRRQLGDIRCTQAECGCGATLYVKFTLIARR
jgi:hypothetical protein